MSSNSEVREFLVSRRALQLGEAERAHLFGLARAAGDLDLTYEAFGLPSAPGLATLVSTAEPDTPTARSLGFLACWAAARRAGADSRR